MPMPGGSEICYAADRASFRCSYVLNAIPQAMVQSVAIIGAGNMGSGIAQKSAWLAVWPIHGSGSRTVIVRLSDLLSVDSELSVLCCLRNAGIVLWPGVRWSCGYRQ